MPSPRSSAAVFLASLGVFIVLVLFVPVEAGAQDSIPPENFELPPGFIMMQLLALTLPLVIVSLPLAIGNFFLARRIDHAVPVQWLILTLIPIVNLIFLYYVAYKVVFAILDRLKALQANKPV